MCQRTYVIGNGMLSLSKMSLEDLLCHAWRHRWELESSQAMVADHRRVWDDEMRCQGCGSSKTQLRWNDGTAVKVGSGSYNLTSNYQAGCGYGQGEYIVEIRRRMRG